MTDQLLLSPFVRAKLLRIAFVEERFSRILNLIDFSRCSESQMTTPSNHSSVL